MKALSEPEIVTRKGKPVSVIIPINDYQELLKRVEDTEDVAWLKRAQEAASLPPAGGLPRRTQAEVVMYRVLLERGAEKDLARLSSEIHDRVIAAIRPGCRKLAGSKNDWRIRVGDYRDVYR